MQIPQHPMLLLALAGCTTVVYDDPDLELRPCDPSLGSSSESSSDTSSSESSSTGEAFTCPMITDGDVVFDVGGVSRTAYVIGASQATSSSTLLLYWHGTYEGNNNPLSNALPWGWTSIADNANALVVMPRADVEAVSRTNNPFPWWIVCGATNPAQCDRDDDFVFAEMIASCVVEQGLADPNRLTASGMSAGGIMTSHLVERGAGEHDLAAAVSFSGGTPAAYQPTVPISPATAVWALHGGASDVYCGVGQPAGTCGGYEPYAFSAPSEQLATDVNDPASGRFAFVCNHNSGHSTRMESQTAEFLLVANAASAHPWRTFPNLGVDGNPTGWPNMSGGTEWMLRNFGDCHNAIE